MKGLIIKADGEISIEEFSAPLHKSLGQAVGGFIEVVRCAFLPSSLRLVVNEEGVINHLPFNRICSHLYGSRLHGQYIFGDTVIMGYGLVDGEPDLVGLTDADFLLLSAILREADSAHA